MLSVLLTICPLVDGEDDTGVFPGPSHRNVGIPVNPSGRVTEQVSGKESPTIIRREGEDKVTITAAVEREREENVVTRLGCLIYT